MSVRILSYLPSPRLWKATVAARLTGVELDIRGDSREALEEWLWTSRRVRSRPRSGPWRRARPLAKGLQEGGSTRAKRFSARTRSGQFQRPSVRMAGQACSSRTASCAWSPGSPGSDLHSWVDPRTRHPVSTPISMPPGLRVRCTAVPARSARGRPGRGPRVRRRSGRHLPDGIERGLLDRDFLVGEDVTAADIVFACEVALLLSE